MFQPEPLTIPLRLMRQGAVMPRRATDGSAGYDLSVYPDGPVEIPPGGRAILPAGFAIALPSPAWVAMVCIRSGMGARGLCLANGVGIVDSDYRGELRLSLINHGDQPCTLAPGDRVAQLLILPVAAADFTLCEALPETPRGGGGYGSTGRNWRLLRTDG